MDKDALIKMIMKEPHALQLSEYEERMRRNLLAYSVVSIAACILGAAPTKSPVLFGLVELNNFSGNVILCSLSVLVLYELVNYGSSIFNSFSYWRVRLTGTRIDSIRGSRGTLGSENEQADYSGEDRNSSIYTWMFERAPSFHACTENIVNYGSALKNACDRLDETDGLIVDSSDINGRKQELIDSINQLIEYIESVRINESMRRFDNWFNMMVRSQSLRWLILDCAIPIMLAVCALLAISQSLFNWIPEGIVNLVMSPDPVKIDVIVKVL